MENKKLIQRKQNGGALDQDRIEALADAIKDKPQDAALDLVSSWNEDGWINDIEYDYLIDNVVNKNKTTTILPEVVVEHDRKKAQLLDETKEDKMRLKSVAPRDATNVVVQTNPDYTGNSLDNTILPEVVIEHDQKKKLYQDDGDRDRYIPNNDPKPSYADRLFSAAGLLGRGLQYIPHKGVQTAGKLLSLSDVGYDMYKVSKNNTLLNKDTEDLVSDVTLGSNYKPPISKVGSKIGKLRLLYYLTNANAMYHDFAGMTNTDVIYSPYKKNTSYTGVYR